MGEATFALFPAVVIYHDEVGIDVTLSYSETARRIAAWASEQNLEGADLLDPASGPMRAAVRVVVEALKTRAKAGKRD
jgi:hypothetical protein